MLDDPTNQLFDEKLSNEHQVASEGSNLDQTCNRCFAHKFMDKIGSIMPITSHMR